MDRMQQRAPQLCRSDGTLRLCPITARPSSSPAPSTCLLPQFEKLACLGGYHRSRLPQSGNHLLCRAKRAFLATHRPSKYVHADAEVHAACRHTCKHSIKEASQEHRIYKCTCVHPHAHTSCGLRYDAEPTASGVPIQRSPRICLPAGVNLQPWSSDIQPRIATSMSREIDALCATSCAYTLPLGSAPLPPSPRPLALFFLLGSFTPALRRRSSASTSPRKGPYLSDCQNVTPAANLVTLAHDGPLSRVANQQLPDCGWFGSLHVLHQVILNRPDGHARSTDTGVLQPLSCPARKGTVVTSFLHFPPCLPVQSVSFPFHLMFTPCHAA